MEQDGVVATNEYIESELTNRLRKIEDVAEADVLVCMHPILPPLDDIIRNQVEDIDDRKNSLMVILETLGGSIETAERIADVFRYHYSKGEICFLVPNFAMSAGTILVMSGDRILMDYYSVLGPIDPQIKGRNNTYVPALGYLDKFDQLIEKSRNGELTSAEIAFLLQKFDPAELHRFEQAREHSVDLLKKWLVKYKFKNWKMTAGSKRPVDDEMKSDRAKEIAEKLNDTKRWRSHSRGLSIQILRDELKLEVEDFGSEERHAPLNKLIRNYYRLLQDYMHRNDHGSVLHTRKSYRAH
ncbi:MAG TPA: serine dehydrogenasease [Xanthomonadales bacterium]|nr:serine dehydrogenasease [Xanthomonadales bacterium]